MNAKNVHLSEVTEATFEAEVVQSRVPVLVDFTATWCTPCRALAPVLSKIASEEAARLKVVAVDGDDSPGLAARFGVKGFPTLVLLDGGREVARHVGLTTHERLMKVVEAHLAPAGGALAAGRASASASAPR